MALSLLPVQDQIVVKLNELPQQVFESGVPDDTLLAYSTEGKLLPFVVAAFSGFVQLPMERGITGARQDMGRSYLLVSCIGPSERSARQVADLVLEKLTGFKPTDSGELQPEPTGRPYIVYDSNAKPLRYVSEVAFGFPVNTVVS